MRVVGCALTECKISMFVLWCLLIPILSMFVVGAPLRALLARGKILDESSWVQVPFVGIAATVLILQVQVQLDVRVSHGVYGLWTMVALAWLAWLRRGGIKASFATLPVLPFAGAAIALAVQAAGLLAVGANDYVGRGWFDQLNYTDMAECFRSLGFDVGFHNIGQRPWLVRVIELKECRIGQSVLQAYHGVIALSDTRLLFVPTIVLGGPLNALALYLAGLTVGLGRPHAALAGLLAGLVPGVTLMAQEGFLSHALGIPWLLLLPTLLTRYLTLRNVESLELAALAMGALTSIYPEFLALALVLVVGFAGLSLVQQQRRLWHFLGYAVPLAAPWLLNPLFWSIYAYLLPELLAAEILAHIFPWGYAPESLAVVWESDSYFLIDNPALQQGALALAYALTGAGVLGLVTLGIERWRHWRAAGRCAGAAVFALPLAFLGLATLPALVLLWDDKHTYQFFKLLVTVTPLLALGVVALGALAVRVPWGGWRRCAQGVSGSLLLAGIATTGLGSYVLVMQTTRPAVEEHPFLSSLLGQHAALNDDFREWRDHLESLRGQSVLLRPAGPVPGYSLNWGCYFGRHNRLWLADPNLNDGVNALQRPPLVHLCDLKRVPGDCLILTTRRTMLLQPPRSLPASARVREGEHYTVWKLDNRPWAGIMDFASPLGANPTQVGSLWLTQEETAFRVFASLDGFFNLVVTLGLKAAEPDARVGLFITDARGTTLEMECPPGLAILPVYLPRGVSTVTLKLRPASQPAAMHVLDFEFTGAPVASSPGP
jgi:hypothetical protein